MCPASFGKRGPMKEKAGEYKQTVVEAYLFLMLLVHPLYMRDGLNYIGDAKYLFYRNVSLVFVAAALVLLALTRGKERQKLSGIDVFVLAYMGTSLLSFCFSSYKETALLGFSDWHMGLVTQFLIVFGYFLVSRWYRNGEYGFLLIAVAGVAVSFFAVCNRLGMDPLRVFGDMDWFEWNRRNLLATIGNINWFSCYLMTAFPVLLYLHHRSKGWQRALYLAGVWICTVAVLVQGSMSGLVALGLVLVLLLYLSAEDAEHMLKWMEAVLVIPLWCSLVGIFRIDVLLPEDTGVYRLLISPLWIPMLAVCLLIYGGLWSLHLRKIWPGGKIPQGCVGGLLILLAAALTVILALCQRSDRVWLALGGWDFLRFNDSWGSFRGALWAQSLAAFGKGNLREILLGVGPDCFGAHMEAGQYLNITVAGQWADSVYANAHNEILTMLINEGILGAVAYVGIFVAAFLRFRKAKEEPAAVAGLLVMAGYLANNFFSFQQVVSTPLVFLILGICEARIREKFSSCIGTEPMIY